MITSSDIKDILEKYQERQEHYSDYARAYIIDYRYVKDSSFDDVVREILELFLEQRQENAELSAKVKAYEAIIENSNFKMAVQRRK